MKNLLTLLAILVGTIGFSKDAQSGKVVAVIDGNTIEVMTESNESYKILLYGIDSPELGQAYGEKAKKFLQKMVLDKIVKVTIESKDRWGNLLGVVLIDGNKDPRYELLEAGLAWTSERSPIQEFETIKDKAREKGKGLWKEEDPTPPWIYRRQQTMVQLKSS